MCGVILNNELGNRNSAGILMTECKVPPSGSDKKILIIRITAAACTANIKVHSGKTTSGIANNKRPNSGLRINNHGGAYLSKTIKLGGGSNFQIPADEQVVRRGNVV